MQSSAVIDKPFWHLGDSFISERLRSFEVLWDDRTGSGSVIGWFLWFAMIWGCVPLGCSGSGSATRDHSDHVAGNEPMNPLWT